MARNRRRARKDSYLSKRREKNKRFLRMVLSLLVVASLGFLYLNYSMNKENAEMTKDITSSEKKLEDVKAEINSLKEDYEMRNTDKFKEKVAEEKLGMVKKSKDDDEEKEESSVIKPPKKSDGENQANPANNRNANPSGEENPSQNENNKASQTSLPNPNDRATPNSQAETVTNENGR